MKKSIKLIALLALAVVLATSVFALTACGEKTLPEATGLEYKDVTIVFNDGEHYRNGYEVVGLGTETLTSFAIPATYHGKPVVSISENAFKNSNIVEIALPESVYAIWGNAFGGCTSLQKVTALGVASIWRGAFEGCSSLTTVVLQINDVQKWTQYDGKNYVEVTFDDGSSTNNADILVHDSSYAYYFGK